MTKLSFFFSGDDSEAGCVLAETVDNLVATHTGELDKPLTQKVLCYVTQ